MLVKLVTGLMKLMEYKKFDSLKVSLQKNILLIQLSRPEVSNAINYDMVDALVSTFTTAEQDTLVRAVVLTGEGKNFCSGGDIKNMLNKSDMFQGDNDELRRRYEQGIQRISKSLESFSKPLIAAVNGAAAGAGCDIACMCDMRIGTADTKFLENFVKVGLVPGDGGSFFLQRIVGFAKAMEMTLTGRTVQGDEAQRIGLLNQLTTSEKLLEVAVSLAEQLASLPAAALQMSKKALKISYLHDLNTSLDLLAAYQGIAQRTDDHFEAISAIKENRNPVFNKT